MGRTTNGKGYNNTHKGCVKTQTPRIKSPNHQQQNMQPSFFRRERDLNVISENSANSLLMLNIIAMKMR